MGDSGSTASLTLQLEQCPTRRERFGQHLYRGSIIAASKPTPPQQETERVYSSEYCAKASWNRIAIRNKGKHSYRQRSEDVKANAESSMTERVPRRETMTSASPTLKTIAQR